MALQLPAGEPEAGPWRAELLRTIIEEFAGPGRAGRGRPVILAVDGRSNGGKTTLAARIAKASPAAQRTWERADVFVCGTPEVTCDPETEVVVAPALQRACVGEAGVGGDD